MSRRPIVATAVLALALGGCASSSEPEAAVKEDFRRGISQIRGTDDDRRLRAELLRTVARLRRDPAPTTRARRARELAIQGFRWTLKGIDSRIEFHEEDSGEVAEATRDALRERRSLRQGAELLRAAGRLLRVRVGSLSGY
jgi:hypothetical protein